jgi:glycosyltransferase involved in cell wall biosynthesis
MCLGILKSDERFDVQNIKLNYSESMADVGKLNLKKIRGLYQVTQKIRKQVKEFQPDIVYFVPAVTGFALIRDFLFLTQIKLFSKAKLILHMRGQFKKQDLEKKAFSYMIKDLLKCDEAIVLGPELISNVTDIVPVPKVTVLPNALPNSIPDADFKLMMAERQKSEMLNLLFLSNMQEAKGWFKVLQACKLLMDAGKPFRCHFVGGWSPASFAAKEKFFHYIEENKLQQNVFFHGPLLRQEKEEMMKQADVLVFPTEYDACPRVVLEAMEYGIPVVANREGTIPSMVDHEQTGFVLEKNTPEEILEKLVCLMNKNFRTEMGWKARQRFLEHFTLETYKDKFLQIFTCEKDPVHRSVAAASPWR